MARRLNGEGSISWSVQRKMFVIAISVSGKRIYRYSKTEQEAVQKLKDLNAKFGIVKIDKNISLERWFNEWLFEIKASSLKVRFIKDYQSIFQNHVEKYHLAKMRITEITKMDITKHLNQLAREGKSIQIIEKVKLRLNGCFIGADDFIVKNPCENITLPKAKDNSRHYTKDNQKHIKTLGDEGAYNAYTITEQNKLLEVLKLNENWFTDLLFIFIQGTGLRLGEALALNYKLDFVNQNVIVREALQRVPVYEGRKIVRWERQITPTKSESSERVVPIPDNIMALLKVRMNEVKVKSKEDPFFINSGLLFPNELGDYLNDRRVLRELKRYNEKLQLSNVNVHGLRHTYATRLLELREPIQVISKLLGHKKVEMTQEIYTHVLEGLKTKL